MPNKSFGQLLHISSKNFKFLKTYNSEFSYVEVWFTDQNSNLPEIEDEINITLVINQRIKYKSNTDHPKKSATDELKTASKERFKKQQKQLVI